MPNPNGNPNLKGNKNSGRKSTRVEFAKNEAVRIKYTILILYA